MSVVESIMIWYVGQLGFTITAITAQNIVRQAVLFYSGL